MKCNRGKIIAKLSELVKCDPMVLCDFPIGLPNFKISTLGGSIFWKDIGTIKGWRMQQHIFSGHWRLLNPENVRYAWGTNMKMVEIFTRAAEDDGQQERDDTEDI